MLDLIINPHVNDEQLDNMLTIFSLIFDAPLHNLRYDILTANRPWNGHQQNGTMRMELGCSEL